MLGKHSANISPRVIFIRKSVKGILGMHRVFGTIGNLNAETSLHTVVTHTET